MLRNRNQQYDITIEYTGNLNNYDKTNCAQISVCKIS